MRILITGGAGFIGSHIVDHALKAGHNVAVLDNLSTGKQENIPPDIQLYAVNLCDRSETNQAVTDFKPEVVCHQAGQVSVAFSMRMPSYDVSNNVMGSISLLDACIRNDVKRIVFASTGGAIYGEVLEPRKAKEIYPPDPKSPYAMSKLYVEQLLAMYKREYGLEYNILRYSNVYGPRQDGYGEAGVVAIFLQALLNKKVITINGRESAGDSGCIRDYVYVDDVAKANLLALEGKIEPAIMNVATGEGYTTFDALACLLDAISNADPEKNRLVYSIEYTEPRPGDVKRSILDPTLFYRLVGEPTSLQAGLGKYIA